MKTSVDGLEGQRPRLTHFSITSGAEVAFRHNFKGINHGAFEEGLDKIGAERRKTAAGSPKGERSESINRFNRFSGVGGKAFGLNSSFPWDEWLNSILLILSILSKNPFKMGHSSAAR